MAKFNGNIFNRALGSIGGQTFSQAAYRGGKLQTGRQRVAPTNPRTPAQVQQRNRIGFVSHLLRQVPTQARAEVWRGITTRLPLFQRFQMYLIDGMKLVVNNWALGDSYPRVPGNGLHFPNSWSLSSTASRKITIAWSTETGENGDAADVANLLILHKRDLTPITGIAPAFEDSSAHRSDGSITIDLSGKPHSNGHTLVFLHFVTSPSNLPPSPSMAQSKSVIVQS